MNITAAQIAELVGGTIVGNPAAVIDRPAKIEEGAAGTISFLANTKYEAYLYASEAAAILVPTDFTPTQEVLPTLIYVADVYAAVAILLKQFSPNHFPPKGIDKQAIIHPQAKVADDVAIGAFVVVEAGATIGKGAILFPQTYVGHHSTVGAATILYAGVKIYADCQIGENCILHSNVVIGSDGFGFAPQAGGTFEKIPQLGNVIIEAEVEIGANTVVDRATLPGTSTVLKRGAKLDNLIQIAHNVIVGENTVIAAQAGIAGSTEIGKNCMIGGQAGFAGHIKIADRTRVQGQSGVASTIKSENTALYGSPALDYSNYLRSYSVFKKLPDLYRKINQLERTIKSIQSEK
ncbi:MAG: UDP-3-O-(3-hydroxymyristoyl)glucosamine N-acyltransferase [Saprospiraceae bacterium]